METEGLALVINKNEISKTVIQVLAKTLLKKEEDVRPEHALVEDLEMDSFYAVELLFELEDRYGIEIPDEEAENFKKVQDIIEYIENRLEQK